MKRLRGAVRFLTILPVPGEVAPPGECAVFFPLIGVGIAWIGYRLVSLLEAFVGSALAALVGVAFWTWIGGGLHEDGLADVADAFGSPRPASKILAILKDSRIGTWGTLALIFVVAFRWQSVQRLPASAASELAACFALARAAMVVLAWTTRPVGEGLAARFAAGLSSPGALVATGSGLIFAFALAGFQLGLLLTALAVLLTWMLRSWFEAKLGGVNGDCLGATCLLVESFLMGVASCRTCTW
ncbi:MAG: adenosylcobinamide-GDP ribazoletransferase [Bryobacteraceae bacterium]|nr:adenosylcobinamide-GDP ribazoletransferase [Bryobacteraceae bacterium]MDW8379342.1 adenosylcobinamide-GDP ribazoletransferase [Bryobacterales bacterium]